MIATQQELHGTKFIIMQFVSLLLPRFIDLQNDHGIHGFGTATITANCMITDFAKLDSLLVNLK